MEACNKDLYNALNDHVFEMQLHCNEGYDAKLIVFIYYDDMKNLMERYPLWDYSNAHDAYLGSDYVAFDIIDIIEQDDFVFPYLNLFVNKSLDGDLNKLKNRYVKIDKEDLQKINMVIESIDG